MFKAERKEFKRIHIMGASGTGTTSLARELCKALPFRHFDSDDYFWKKKFTEPSAPEIRVAALGRDLESAESWILSGALIDWGNPLIPLFDLVIFVSVSDTLRLKRLKLREEERYGSTLEPGRKNHKMHREFMDWASSYEKGGMEIRSRVQQECWLERLSCPILRIQNDGPFDESLWQIRDYLGGHA